VNEQDAIVPAIAVPYSPAKSAKKSTGQLVVTVASVFVAGLVALANEPTFVAKVAELAGDNKTWIAVFAIVRLVAGFLLDRKKHLNAPNLVEVKD
jgi:hypothetical protein